MNQLTAQIGPGAD